MANFWSSPISTDPKRASRWILVTNHIPVYTLKTVKKPSFTIEKIEHKYLNHTFKYPANVTWEDVEFTLVDPVDPDAAATIIDIISRSGYRPLRNATDFSTISKDQAIRALGEVKIMQVNANGVPIETWTLAQAWISNVDMGELSYDSEELTEIKLTVTYDWASLIVGAGQRSNYDASGYNQVAYSNGLRPESEDDTDNIFWNKPE